MIFSPPVAVASLSGESDARWARGAEPYVGAAFLGGIAIDTPTRNAARAMVDRDRTEFLPDDPIAFIDDQLDSLHAASLQPGFNVRAVRDAPLADAATVCRDHDAMLEINAHCRQAEMCAAGAGETLLQDVPRLRQQVRTAADAGARVSVKVRAEVAGVDLPALARELDSAGADLIHVDAMDSEGVVAAVAAASDCAIVANNGVRDRRTVREYLAYGADAVSVGRPSDDPRVLDRVRRAATEWFDPESTADRDGSSSRIPTEEP